MKKTVATNKQEAGQQRELTGVEKRDQRIAEKAAEAEKVGHEWLAQIREERALAAVEQRELTGVEKRDLRIQQEDAEALKIGQAWRDKFAQERELAAEQKQKASEYNPFFS